MFLAETNPAVAQPVDARPLKGGCATAEGRMRDRSRLSATAEGWMRDRVSGVRWHSCLHVVRDYQP